MEVEPFYTRVTSIILKPFTQLLGGQLNNLVGWL